MPSMADMAWAPFMAGLDGRDEGGMPELCSGPSARDAPS